MAAPTNESGSKDKPKQKPWHYISLTQPTDDVLKFFVEHMPTCDMYESDYHVCKAFSVRVNQYFVYGKEIDCEHFKHMHTACEKFLETGEKQYKDYMFEYEKAKRDHRVKSATANDVWEYRTSPYTEWNKPLNKVPLVDIRAEDDIIIGRLNANQNNTNIPSKNMSELSETNLTVKSSDKEGNSNDKSDEKAAINIKNEKVNSSNSKKGWCAVS